MTGGHGTLGIADAERSAKGRHWMRALQRQVADAWASTTETDTSLCRIHGMETECEVVAISTAFAVTAVRILDNEVFCKEHGQAYLDAKTSDRQGKVVDGLVLIRNAEIHLPVILDPDVQRVLSLGSAFRVVPKWRPYDQLPADVQNNTKTSERCHAAYRTAVEGEPVIETLLDAIAWFVKCDPSLAQRDEAEELKHFPLPELWQHEYERRHPDWVRRCDVEAELRAKRTRELPVGDYRSIQHRLLDGDLTVAFCGYTFRNGYRSAFTETPEQIVRDIAGGYRYYVGTADEVGEMTHHSEMGNLVGTVDEEIWVNGSPLDGFELSPFSDEPPTLETWRSWFELAAGNAFMYARERQGE